MQLTVHRHTPTSEQLTQGVGLGLSVDHIVEAVKTIGDKVMLGGEFQRLGPWTGGFSSLPIKNGKVIPTPEVHSVFFNGVSSIVANPSGGYYVGGGFLKVDGQNVLRLARLKDNLLLDSSFGINIGDGTVTSLAISGDYLYVGGSFTLVNGSSRTRLMRVRLSTGTVDSGWNPVIDSTINAMLVRGSRLIIGGAFTTIDMGSGAQSRPRLAAFSLTDGSLTAWAPTADNSITRLQPFGTDWIVAAGNFANVNSTARSRLAVLSTTDDSNASNLKGVAHTFDNAIYGLAVDGNYIYVTGTFRTIDGTLIGSLARLNYTTPASGALDTSWQPKYNTTSSNNQVQIIGEHVYVSLRTIGYQVLVGDLSVANASGTRVPTVFRVRKDTAALDSTFMTEVFEGVGDSVVIGNRFFAIGHVGSDQVKHRDRIAQIDRDTHEITDFVADTLGGYVVGFEEGSSNSIYAFGNFTSVNAVSRTGLAKLNFTTGALDTTFNPTFVRAAGNPEVRAAKLVNSILFVAGRFDSVNGTPRNGLALLDPNTGALLANNINFEVNSEGQVTDIFVDTLQQRVLISGTFTSVKNLTTTTTTARNYFAAFDFPVSPSIDFTLNAASIAFNSTAHQIRAFDSSSIYVSGAFSAPSSQIIRLNRSTLAQDGTFVPPAFNNWIRQFDLYQGSIYVAGNFTTMGGASQTRLAKLDASTGAGDTNFKPYIQDYLYSFEIDQRNGNFFGGGYQYGSFDTFDTWNLTHGNLLSVRAIDWNLSSH